MPGMHNLSYPKPASEAIFRMVNVGRKRPTHRMAIACGTLHLKPSAYEAVKTGTLAKGDALALAEAAGILGAKNTPALIPLCHTLPLDQVSVTYGLNDAKHTVTVYVQAHAFAKTGVEMEALCGVQASLLAIWDLAKACEPALLISDVKLLVKTGGKSGVWTNPDGIPDWLTQHLPAPPSLAGMKAGVLVMSDRAAQGVYEDKSGLLLCELLTEAGGEVADYRVIPDNPSTIAATLRQFCSEHELDFVLASGGTGPGPRDVTPDVLRNTCERMFEGLGEFMRRESQHFTDTAWLSRMTAGMLGRTLVLAMPGSPKAVRECWEIISPFLGDALGKIRKQGY
jgi:molybdenum cofactor biosynthesis protein MoaC